MLSLVWEKHAKHRAGAGVGREFESAAVHLGVLPRQGQTEPGAAQGAGRLVAALEKRLEQLVAVFRRHARALIADADFNAAFDQIGVKPDSAALRAETDGVEQQVLEQAFQLGAVALHL